MKRSPVFLAALALCNLTACTAPASNTSQSASPPPSASTVGTAAEGETTVPAPTSQQLQPPATGIAACPAEQLSLSITPSGSGAGSTLYTLTLTNNGAECDMTGFPGVSLVDAAENQLGAPAKRDGEQAGGVVQPGESMDFQLRSSNPHIHNCTSVVDSALVKVYPPNDTGWLTAPLVLPVCADETVETLSLSG